VLRRHAASLAALSFALLVAHPSWALSYSNLFVLGDSLVDAGNTQALVLALTGGATDVTPAAAGYYNGRFTNGINPADVMNLAVEGSQSVKSWVGGDNFSFGGARARTDGDFIADLSAQTTSLLTAHPALDSGALYMINIGGNDVRDIILGGLTGAARQAVIDAAALAVQTSVASLQAAGATNILFVGVGNVGSTPESALHMPPLTTEGRQASIDMNTAIQSALPGGVMYFDTIALTDAVAANPAAFGLPPGILQVPSCISAGASPTCTNYAFFDNVHPTTQVLQILGNQLVAFVPEPGTGCLVAIGLFVMSARARRGRSALLRG
jgi:outer membrane lipase/esterase